MLNILAIWEMQIKTTLWFQFYSDCQTNKNQQVLAGKHAGKRTHTCCRYKCQFVQWLWKSLWRFLKNLNRTFILPSDTTSVYAPKIIKVNLLWRYLHSYVYCDIIHNGLFIELAKRTSYIYTYIIEFLSHK
jgi:hypothetical protein